MIITNSLVVWKKRSCSCCLKNMKSKTENKKKLLMNKQHVYVLINVAKEIT